MSRRTVLSLLAVLLATGCVREPELYLYDSVKVDFNLPVIDLALEVYWDYELSYEVNYDWHAEWHYGWDAIDEQLFGTMGYTEPSAFNLRRYYTGSTPMGEHLETEEDYITGTTFRGRYKWGFWDLLVWNDIQTLDGIQSLQFEENDVVTASTGQSMNSTRYHAPHYTHSFYEPEPLYAAYSQGIEISADLKGFDYDPVNDVYVRKLNMTLEPVTYIYLTQVILHNNRGRIAAVDGNANMSGLARSVTLNTGIASDDPISIYYKVRMKNDCECRGEQVDIVGGRLMTFGICNTNGSRTRQASDIADEYRHYMDVTMQFNNGMDSVFVFDVTRQVREHYKGGVITVELDVDTIPIPTRSGGSGFDAVVKPVEDGGTYEFEM